MACWIILVELIFTVVWLIIRDFQVRNWIWAIFFTLWNFKAGKSTSRLKFVQKQQILISQCSGSKKLRWQSRLTNLWHRDRLWGRTDFTDFEMLDAMIASALKRLLDKQILFRKRVSVEEQRAQNSDRFFSGRQIAYMIHEHFRATGACEAVRGLSDLFTLSLHNDDVQDFDVWWDQALLSASEIPADVILEGLYKSKLQDSVQLQTVLALYDQETARNNWQTHYLRLKTAVKLHIDQMMRTRNFRVRNEVVERGSVTKSLRGKKGCVERKVGECCQWKAHEQFSTGDSCSFSRDTQAWKHWQKVKDKKGPSSSPASHSKAKQTDGEGQKSLQGSGSNRKALWTRVSMPIQI